MACVVLSLLFLLSIIFLRLAAVEAGSNARLVLGPVNRVFKHSN